MKRRPAFTVVLLLASCALLAALGCSGNDGSGSLFGPGSSRAVVGGLSGTWEGEAGNTRAPATLVIVQDGYRLEGTLTWPGDDVRTFQGEVGDPFVELRVPTGVGDRHDVWFLSAREGRLEGIALERAYWGGYNARRTYDLRFRLAE